MNSNPELSVVIPCHNEENNLGPLTSAIQQALEPISMSYEIVITDDCSTDGSWAELQRLAKADPRIRALRFEVNGGQSAAMWAGLRAARGRLLATLDADMQNDPADLPNLLAGLAGADCVCGTRVAARAAGDNWVRRYSSRIANSVRNRLSGEEISDAGCCFRIFRRECIADVKFFKGGHRFLPTLIKMEGFTVKEVAIRHNPRFSGASHYGVWNRLFKSFVDLMAVRWMKQRMIRYQIKETLN
ncbi:MAG: glycosyltransferase family 2 protein [Verrucomicrobiota bacterium]